MFVDFDNKPLTSSPVVQKVHAEDQENGDEPQYLASAITGHGDSIDEHSERRRRERSQGGDNRQQSPMYPPLTVRGNKRPELLIAIRGCDFRVFDFYSTSSAKRSSLLITISLRLLSKSATTVFLLLAS